MADIIERRIGGWTVRLDRHLCVGFGDCIDEAPAIFVFDDEGIAAFLPEVDAASVREHLVRACEACPVDAISLHAPPGKAIR
ncbi:MAG: ferredoxin [Longimicrobiales bacterium]